MEHVAAIEDLATGAQLAPAGLEDLIAPLNKSEFLSKYWNRRFLHLSGNADRFSGLSSWEHVNTILEQHMLQPPRIRVVKNGIAVPANSYIDLSRSEFPRVKGPALLKHFYDGAMLELNCIEDTHWPLRKLNESLANLFHTSVWAMLFGSWRDTKGFNLHWDHHEVFVLQIAGRKHWKVYNPTEAYPYLRPVSDAVFPVEQPVFDGVIERGTLLYLPRGWWHVAYPLNEPSLHLSFGVKTPTGIDLFKWFAEQLIQDPSVRRDVPFLASVGDQRAYAKLLLDSINSHWNDRPTINEFLTFHDSLRRRAPKLSLPRVESD